MSRPLRVQAKLSVGDANDPAEREADAVADRVLRALEQGHSIDRSWDAGGAEGGRIRRSPATREPYEPPAGRIQRSSAIGLMGGALDDETSARVEQQRSSGRALTAGVRRSMEGAFGADFSSVRIHTGREASALNRSMSAEAFTSGSDVFFRDGAPDASRSDGTRLLAHELTHVVQQGHAKVRRQPAVPAPGPSVLRRRAVAPALERRRMAPDDNPRVDGQDPAKIGQLQNEIRQTRIQDQQDLERGAGRAKSPAANTNHRGGVLGKVAYKIKSAFMKLPDVAVRKLSPAGPNGTAHIDPTDYGICDTETIGDGDVRMEAVRDGDEWKLRIDKCVARYSKIIQLPAGVTDVTGPGSGDAGETTTANSGEQIRCLLATFGPPWYMLSAVDGHESTHEERLLPALRQIAPEVRDEFAAISVPAVPEDADPTVPIPPGQYADAGTALAALKLLPDYAAALTTTMGLWDAKYDELIAEDHQGKAQKGEEKASRPMIAKINKFRVDNGLKKIPVKYTWTKY